MSPLFVFLFVGGSIVLEKFIRDKGISWLKGIVLGLISVVALVLLPLARPVLPVDIFIQYNTALGLGENIKYESTKKTLLPQHYADRFGWQGLTDKVAAVYQTLSPGEQEVCAIVTLNYGRAGAIEYYGKKNNLPKPVCGHLNYYLWGTRDQSGDVVIFIGDTYILLNRFYKDVTLEDRTQNNYVMYYENNVSIYLCKGKLKSLEELLESIKAYN